jgi:acyl-CoA reductase-like NAD-dependent aldehyde dehydrogenase
VLEDARKKGATVAAGGERIGDSGNFFAPTVLTDVPLDADVFNNEPFGPIAAIRGFDTLDEAIAEANRLPFGLAGYAFTKSIKNADLLSQKLELGMLWINQPAMPVARNAVRRRQGFGLRLGRRPRGARGVPEHQGCFDHGRSGRVIRTALPFGA